MRADERTAAGEDRQIVVSRRIDAPRRIMFKAWMEVRHLSRWFGPAGFSTTTSSFAFRAGGVWEFVMHGPDGSDYSNHIEWLEIMAPGTTRWKGRGRIWSDLAPTWRSHGMPSR